MNLVEVEDEVDEILELLVPAERRKRGEAFQEVVVEVDFEEFPTILIGRENPGEELLHLGSEEAERLGRVR